jgi:hypothetical protein
VGDLSNALSRRAHRSVRRACGTTLRSRDALRPSSYGESSRPSKQRAQGRPDAWPAPMARLQTKSRRQSPQVGRTTGLPCVMVGRLIRALPGDRLSCPRVATTRDTRCAGHQHRDARTTRFRRRIGYVRPREMTHAATRHAHRIPHPTSVTTAKRPLMRGRMAYQIINSEKKKQEFFREALDGLSALKAFAKLAFRRTYLLAVLTETRRAATLKASQATRPTTPALRSRERRRT